MPLFKNDLWLLNAVAFTVLVASVLVAIPLMLGGQYEAGFTAITFAGLTAALLADEVQIHAFWGPAVAVALISVNAWEFTIVEHLRYRGFGGNMQACVLDAYVLVSYASLAVALVVSSFLFVGICEVIRGALWERARRKRQSTRA